MVGGRATKSSKLYVLSERRRKKAYETFNGPWDAWCYIYFEEGGYTLKKPTRKTMGANEQRSFSIRYDREKTAPRSQYGVA